MVFNLGCKELIPLFSILAAGPASAAAVFSTVFKFDHWLEMVNEWGGCLPMSIDNE